MSTIQDVRTAEQKLQSILEELKRAGADDPQNLARKLTIASEEYAKAVRELNSHGGLSHFAPVFSAGNPIPSRAATRAPRPALKIFLQENIVMTEWRIRQCHGS